MVNGVALWQPGSPDTFAGGFDVYSACVYLVAPTRQAALAQWNSHGIDSDNHLEFSFLHEAFVNWDVSKRLASNPGMAVDGYMGSGRETGKQTGQPDRST